MPRRPTQKDVAERAGVSRVTVSLVLSGKIDGTVPISPETQERVLNAAQELGYAPNPMAQILKQGSSRLLGVFVYEPEFPYDVDNYLFHHLLGVQREAAAQSYNLVSFTSNYNQGNPKIYQNNMNSIRLADGCIIMGARPDRDELRRLIEEKYPFVYIGRREIAGYEIDWVSDDYVTGSQQAVEHLLDLGHRRIGFLIDDDPLEATVDKLEGCKSAISNHDAQLIVIPGPVFGAPANLPQTLIENDITALVCRDYHSTFVSSMELLEANRLRVPHDVSVLTLTPPVRTIENRVVPTFVQLDRSTVGREATRLLIQRLQKETPASNRVLVPCELIIGETTGPSNC